MIVVGAVVCWSAFGRPADSAPKLPLNFGTDRVMAECRLPFFGSRTKNWADSSRLLAAGIWRRYVGVWTSQFLCIGTDFQ